MRQKTANVASRINSFLLSISAIFLLIATILAVANAVVRFAHLGNLTWADEVNTILMIMLVFIAQSSLEFNDKQLAISILQSTLKSKKAKTALVVVRGIVTMAITGYLLFYCIKVTEKAAKYNYVTNVLMFPRKYLYAVIIAAFALVIISWIVTIICKASTYGADVDIGVIDESIIDQQVKDFAGNAQQPNEEKSIDEGGAPKC